MGNLMDIAPLTERVKVGEEEIEVKGISATDVVQLFSRYPEIQNLLSKENRKLSKDISPETLIQMIPGAVAEVIAIGTGHSGNSKAEKVAASLPLGIQVELLGAILRLTLPRGLGPLVEQIQAIAATVGKDPAEFAPSPLKKKSQDSSSTSQGTSRVM